MIWLLLLDSIIWRNNKVSVEYKNNLYYIYAPHIEYSIWKEKNVEVGIDIEVFKNEKDLKQALEIALEIFDKPQPIYPEVFRIESNGIMVYKDSLNWDIYVGEVRLTLWQISKILKKINEK
jgi:hypothetical protein